MLSTRKIKWNEPYTWGYLFSHAFIRDGIIFQSFDISGEICFLDERQRWNAPLIAMKKENRNLSTVSFSSVSAVLCLQFRRKRTGRKRLSASLSDSFFKQRISFKISAWFFRMQLPILYWILTNRQINCPNRAVENSHIRIDLLEIYTFNTWLILQPNKP